MTLTHKQIDALELDKELKLRHCETIKKAWMLRLWKRGTEKWEKDKKLGVTLNANRSSK